jgi:hypothetical protein
VTRWLGVLRWLDPFNWREAVRWRILVAVYAVVVVAALFAVNADQANTPAALGMVAAASWLLGWGTGSGWGAVVAWMLVPVALVFGDANQYTDGGAPDPVVVLAALSAAISTALVLLAAGARTLYGRRRKGPRLKVRNLERDRASAPAGTSGADMRLAEERPRPARDRGARKGRSLRHPTGHRR